MSGAVPLPREQSGDELRAHAFALLGALFAAPPEDEIMAALRGIEVTDGDEDALLASAWRNLRYAAEKADVAAVNDEYHDLFIGVGRGELVPFGSWYMTGFMMERPLAALREDLSQLGFERQDDVKEPEDHIAALCETMALLIQSEDAGLDRQRQFFERHMAPWVNRFFLDLQKAKTAHFYKGVATFGEKYIDFESEYLRMLV